MNTGATLARGFEKPKVSWPLARASDLFELQYGRSLVASDRNDGPVPVFGTNGRTGWHSISLFRGPGVILGRKGQGPLGVEWCDSDYWVIDTAYSLKLLSESLHPRYCYYLIKYVGLNHLKDGTSNPSLSRDTFGAQLMPIAPPQMQSRISALLAALDDKIELNRRTNETLEAMARALFQSWFVDFDPVRAKMEGRKPQGMDEETARLLPNALHEDKPLGWTVVPLGAATTKIGSGATPRGGDKAYVDEGVALIRSQNVYDSAFVWAGLVRITDDDARLLAGVSVQRGDNLLNITGASILRTCIVEDAVLPARVNQHVAIIRPRAGVPPSYVHLHLLRGETKAFLLGHDAGGSRQAVTKGHIESIPLLMPPQQILDGFSRLADPIFARIAAARTESRVLAMLRDTLLPKLLSGELRIPDAERAVSAAL